MIVKGWLEIGTDDTKEFVFIFSTSAVIDPYDEAHIILNREQLGIIVELGKEALEQNAPDPGAEGISETSGQPDDI